MKDKSFTRDANVAFRTIEGTTFLASPYSKKIYPLNNVGDFIWDKLKQSIAFNDLLNNIYNEFDVEEGVAAKDLREFLEELLKEKLIK